VFGRWAGFPNPVPSTGERFRARWAATIVPAVGPSEETFQRDETGEKETMRAIRPFRSS